MIEPDSPPSSPSPASPAPPLEPISSPRGPSSGAAAGPRRGPSYVFFGSLAAIALMADVATKAWAEITLSSRAKDPAIKLIENHLSLNLAYNRGGAWGLLQNASEF